MTKLTMTLGLSILSVALTACSSSKDVTPLPQGGPTTAQIVHAGAGEYSRSSTRGASQYERITPPNSMSSLTSRRLRDLNEDFKRVPNPQILGWVAPHFNQSNMPVPGYFTTFRLYKKDSYALFSEDAATGLSEVEQ